MTVGVRGNDGFKGFSSGNGCGGIGGWAVMPRALWSPGSGWTRMVHPHPRIKSGAGSSPLPSRERGSAGMIGGMPRPFVPGFWVPAPVSGYGAGPAGMTGEYAGE